jgi:hypothetical protein
MANEIINTRRREFLGASALVVSSALLGVSAMTTRTVAADYKQNPFTLVYDGAITANDPGKVNIHPVKYKLNGLDIVANVYTPAGYDPAKSYPTLVLAHPNGGVKEQTTGLYAQRLAELHHHCRRRRLSGRKRRRAAQHRQATISCRRYPRHG